MGCFLTFGKCELEQVPESAPVCEIYVCTAVRHTTVCLLFQPRLVKWHSRQTAATRLPAKQTCGKCDGKGNTACLAWEEMGNEAHCL